MTASHENQELYIEKNDDNVVHRVFGKVISCLHDNWYHIPGVVGAGVGVVTGSGTERK